MRPKNTIIPYRIVDTVLKTVLHFAPVNSLVEEIAFWWGYRFRPAPAIARLRSGAKMLVTVDDHLQLLLYYIGTFEPKALEAMKSRLSRGATVLDVGANIGFYTIEAAQVIGSKGRVIAIEPSPLLLEKLKRHVEINKLSNVSIVDCAVGHSTGTVTLTLPENAHHGMLTLGRVTGSEKAEVKLRRIDDIVHEQEITSLDFVKMDIEGSEFDALLGATETLKKFKPPILIELNNDALQRCGATTEQVKDLLIDLGYKGFLVGKDMKPIMPRDTHDCDECLFLANDPSHPRPESGMIFLESQPD